MNKAYSLLDHKLLNILLLHLSLRTFFSIEAEQINANQRVRSKIYLKSSTPNLKK